MTARKGYRWCAKGEHWRAERFFKPKGRVCTTCQKKRNSKARHEARVTTTYGLEKGEYDKLLEEQDGCGVCGIKPRYRMDVDHDHSTNLIRGLLCRQHNRRLLPAAKDKPEVLRSAADYLEDPPALRILGERYYQGE